MSRLRHLMVMPDGRLELVGPTPLPVREVQVDVLAGIDPAVVAANRARIAELKLPHRPPTVANDPWPGRVPAIVAMNSLTLVAMESSYSQATRRALLAVALGVGLRACGCPVEAAKALARRWAARRAHNGAPAEIQPATASWSTT
jgi:hypothetical protein